MHEDDSRNFADIGDASAVEQITIREAMQWISANIGFGVVHAGRYTPVEKWAIFDREPVPHGVSEPPRRYTLQDCYGTDIPTAEGLADHRISVFVWSRPTP